MTLTDCSAEKSDQVARHELLSFSLTSRHSMCFHPPNALCAQKVWTQPSVGNSIQDQASNACFEFEHAPCHLVLDGTAWLGVSYQLCLVLVLFLGNSVCKRILKMNMPSSRLQCKEVKRHFEAASDH